MNFKSKILAAGLAAIIAGGGIFAANMNAAQAQPAESADVAQLEAQVLQLQQQIAQISALIAQLKSQETCGNGICRFGETAAACPADCQNSNSTTCKTLWWSDNTSKICQQKQFCGTYMYLGLKTYSTQSACQTALDTACSKECVAKGYALGGNYCVANEYGVLEACCCTGSASKCGNGTCDSGETATNCPADCSGIAPGLLSNASKCTLNSECASGICSYGTCCAADQCGWGDDGAGGPRMCVDSKDEKTNQWLQGICINGTWKTVLNGIGCNNFACLSGTCINNKCTCTTADCGKRTCYGEGEGGIGLTAGTAISCCSGLTAQPRTTTSPNGTQAVTEGFVCRKPVAASCKKEGELFGYLEGECCEGLLKVYPDGAKTYSAGESQNFQVTCKKPASYITNAPAKCVAVNIKALANNKYVAAENGGASPLIANRDTAGPWELFYILPAADGSINIKAGFNGKYVTAENGGASPLIANRDTAGPWEKFVLAPIFNTNEVAIMASINNRYVTAENGGAQALVANRDEIGPWEKFTITKVSDCQIQ